MTTDRYVTKEEWIAALRSGDFKQGRGVLASVGYDEFCCIGVYGCLMTDSRNPYTAKHGVYHAVTALIGLRNRHALVSLNDIEGKSFDEIADYLEKLPR